jgi:hypothetical protein
MTLPPEHVHWLFASGLLTLGLWLLTEALVGPEVWRRRRWRAYLWPSAAFGMGILMWPVMTFFANSTIHMLVHGSWAQVMMLAGGANLALVHGKLRSRWWELTLPLAFAASGAGFLIHEQNGWLFSRSAFVHHACGWTLLVGSVIAVGKTVRPRYAAFGVANALTFLVLAVILFTARDAAPIFGHYAAGGVPHR